MYLYMYIYIYIYIYIYRVNPSNTSLCESGLTRGEYHDRAMQVWS